jgi:hypothetical protein
LGNFVTLPKILSALVAVAASFCFHSAEATVIRFQTTLGNIDIRLYDAATPIHVSNILNYINSNRYDGTFIHRSARLQNGEPFVIQGGGYRILTSLFDPPIPSGWSAIPTFGTVQNEPGISNLRGTLALAGQRVGHQQRHEPMVYQSKRRQCLPRSATAGKQLVHRIRARHTQYNERR